MKKTLTDKQLKDMVLGVVKEAGLDEKAIEEKMDKAVQEFEAKSNKEQVEAVNKAYQKGMVAGSTNRRTGNKAKAGDLFGDAMHYAFKSVFSEGKVDLGYMAKAAKDEDPQVHALIKNFIQKKQTVGVAGDGGRMVPEDLSSDFISWIRPDSLFDRLGTRRVEVPHGKKLYNFADSGVSAGWGAELTAPTASKLTVDRRDLELKKLQVLNVQSREVLSQSREDFRAIVMRDIQDAARDELEDKFLNGSGQGDIPLGILAQKDATQELTSAATGADIQEVIRELISLPYFLQNENQRMRNAGYLMAPRDYAYLLSAQDSGIFLLSQIAQGTFMGFNVEVTNYLPENIDTSVAQDGSKLDGSRIVFCDWNEVIEGYGPNMEIRHSRDAMVKDSGGTDINLFTQDAEAILMRQDAGILLRRPKALATAEKCAFSNSIKRD